MSQPYHLLSIHITMEQAPLNCQTAILNVVQLLHVKQCLVQDSHAHLLHGLIPQGGSIENCIEMQGAGPSCAVADVLSDCNIDPSAKTADAMQVAKGLHQRDLSLQPLQYMCWFGRGVS